MASAADRTRALKEFDEAKTGVKGLVDSGITSLPAIFHHPNTHHYQSTPAATYLSIPTVDLSLPRPIAVDLIRSASRDWGFFQLINHGIPLSTISHAISAVRSFHELPPAVRSQHYGRAPDRTFRYFSNIDLFQSTAATWKDSFRVYFGPVEPDGDQIPAVCRSELVAWYESAKEVAREVMGMMCEGLGLGPETMEEMMEMTCQGRQVMLCHFYPPCPEPDRTMGIVDHTDPKALTVLIQDEIGGLQVKKKEANGEEFWVDVKPIPGALVINVGDLLQIMSNDAYKSVPHRVVANSQQKARISIALFFSLEKKTETYLYGPLSQLISSEKQAIYRTFTMGEYERIFFTKELGKSLVEHFKL